MNQTCSSFFLLIGVLAQLYILEFQTSSMSTYAQPSQREEPSESPQPSESPKSSEIGQTLGAQRPLNSQEIDLAFKKGKNAYLYGSYPLVIKSLQPLITPNLLISNPEELAIAYEYLGLAYFYLNRKQEATTIFTSLIYFRPTYEFDPVRVPPNAVSFYTQLKESLADDLADRQAALEEQRRKEAERMKTLMSREVILEQQVNSRLIGCFPFGVGQFQNQDDGMAYFFLSSELIAIALSIGFFSSVESLRQGNGRFSQDDFIYAQKLQNAQLISGGVAIGLMVSGVIHAMIFYKDRRFLRKVERILSSPTPSNPNSIPPLSPQSGLTLWSF